MIFLDQHLKNMTITSSDRAVIFQLMCSRMFITTIKFDGVFYSHSCPRVVRIGLNNLSVLLVEQCVFMTDLLSC